ncbi:MAG: transcriptional regulator [Candidatus Parabeggiatoa sp. nov. 2]|nr:MAG: hypothetical protein B6247_23190 [Beggiatoa sp. 4572_84]RKZ56776.1 MAG: transcriptional regulator [Gammaproteobacteria bacterium]
MTKRDIGQEILDSIRAIKRGEGQTYTMALPEIKIIRERLNLGPSAFAALFGVSTRTLQEWEHGRRKPSGAAQSLLLVAAKRPDVFLDVLKDV